MAGISLNTRDLEILHKITRYKHGGNSKDLITLQEYKTLPDYMKGYAQAIQRLAVGSLISIEEMKQTNDFQKGYQQGKRELSSSINRIS